MEYLQRSSGSTTKDLLKSLPSPLNIYGSISPPASVGGSAKRKIKRAGLAAEARQFSTRRGWAMKKALCAFVGLSTAAFAAVGNSAELLSDQRMDAVTAGAVDAAVDSTATAAGPFNHTDTNGAAAAATEEGSNPAIAARVGVAGGTSTAVAVGPDAETETSVSTSGSADGTFQVNRSVGWTVGALSGEVSGGFTWVSGRTGAFLLGGP
jgi:hypothetical protein